MVSKDCAGAVLTASFSRKVARGPCRCSEEDSAKPLGRCIPLRPLRLLTEGTMGSQPH